MDCECPPCQHFIADSTSDPAAGLAGLLACRLARMEFLRRQTAASHGHPGRLPLIELGIPFVVFS
jgi:hypothetical protein